MQIRAFPPHYQSVHFNIYISSFSVISYGPKQSSLHIEKYFFTRRKIFLYVKRNSYLHEYNSSSMLIFPFAKLLLLLRGLRLHYPTARQAAPPQGRPCCLQLPPGGGGAELRYDKEGRIPYNLFFSACPAPVPLYLLREALNL